jgi:hypothetical protein
MVYFSKCPQLRDIGQKVPDHQSNQAHGSKWKDRHDMGASMAFGLLVGSPHLEGVSETVHLHSKSISASTIFISGGGKTE